MRFSCFLDLPGSAEAQVIRGGIVKRLLIAYFIGKISAKNIKIHSRMSKLSQNQRWDIFWDRLYIGFFLGGGSCLGAPTEFCQVQNSLCVQVLHSPILAALLYGTWGVGVSETLRRGIFTRQSGHRVRHWAVELSSSYCYSCVLRLISKSIGNGT